MDINGTHVVNPRCRRTWTRDGAKAEVRQGRLVLGDAVIDILPGHFLCGGDGRTFRTFAWLRKKTCNPPFNALKLMRIGR